MVVLYQLGFALAFLLFSGTINSYQVNWIGLPKAGIISGQVLNLVDELPIAGAQITVTRGGKEEAQAVTDSNGFFTVPGLAAEDYNVIAENAHYDSLMIEKVPVAIGNEVTTHFILTPTSAYQ
jgi:hypothetical protein